MPQPAYLRVLPGVLRSPITYPAFLLPNEYDECMSGEFIAWEATIAGQPLMELCRPKGRRPYVNKPWVAMPAEGREFKPVGIIDIPDLSDPANIDVPFVVLEVQCPLGYNGVLTDFVVNYTGTGFVPGSGDIVYRISASGRYLRDLGNILIDQGSLTYPSPVPRSGLLLYSQNSVMIEVQFGSGAPATLDQQAKIVGSLKGWWWPR